LTDLDYRVTSRTSSSEALELFKTDSRHYDIVITDQTMPIMTGMELAQALLQIRPEIPVILCTGFSERVTPDMVKSVGIREYVMKPIVKRQMAETIQRALEPTTRRG
jgi:two-component system cell cycle sensor histidine kinase/response regulator CckA